MIIPLKKPGWSRSPSPARESRVWVNVCWP